MITKKKNRYVLFECTEKLSEDIMDMFYSSITSFMGSGSYSNANIKILKVYSENLFALRVNRGYEKQVILASAFSKIMDGKVGFYTLLTSGAINVLSKKVQSINSDKNID